MKRLSEEYETGPPAFEHEAELGTSILSAGMKSMDSGHEAALRTRVLQSIAVPVVGGSAAIHSSTHVARSGLQAGVAKATALKLLGVIIIGVAAAVVMQQYSSGGLDKKRELHSENAGDQSQNAGDQSQNAGDQSQNAGDQSQNAGDQSENAGSESNANDVHLPTAKEKSEHIAMQKQILKTPLTVVINSVNPPAHRSHTKRSSALSNPTAPSSDDGAPQTRVVDNLAEEARIVQVIRTMLKNGQSKAALGEARRYRTRFPKGTLRQDVEFLYLQAIADASPHMLNTVRDTFLHRFPQSPYRAKAIKLNP